MWHFFVFAAAIWAVSLFAPKMNVKEPEPEEFKIPNISEGKELIVVFGRRPIKDPSLVWYGNVQAVAIRKKSGGGLF